MGAFGSEVETVIEETVKKNQQSKPVFQGKYRKGLKLFFLDAETKMMGEVEIEERKDFHLNTRKGVGSKTANINRNHLHIWALNKKNAERKFRKILIQMVNAKMISDLKKGMKKQQSN